MRFDRDAMGCHCLGISEDKWLVKARIVVVVVAAAVVVVRAHHHTGL